MILIILCVIFYVITGIIAYGLLYDDLRFVQSVDKINRLIALLVFGFGPWGLLAAFIVNDSGFKLRFRA